MGYMKIKSFLRKSFLYFCLSIGALLMLAPLLWMVFASFMSLKEILSIPPVLIPGEINFGNYKEVFSQIPFFRFFCNSVIVAVITIISVLLTSALGGYAFAKFDFPGKKILFLLVLGTMMIPFQVRMIPLYVMLHNWGWTDSYKGLIIPGLVEAFGIFLMRQFMQSIPNDLLDAARIDGASEPYIFFRIVLPLTGPALSALTIFTLIGNWESFLWPMIVTNSERLYTLPIGLAMFSGRYISHTEIQMAAATLTVLPLVVAFLILQKKFIQGVALTGLKG
jgi:multiple sugar transport system permease protein